MEKLQNLLEKLTDEEIYAVFDKYGIIIAKHFPFSNINIIIGTNGSGKTRFLKAIKELCLLNGQKVIYGYFPKLSSTKVNISFTENNLPEATLYEAVLYDDYDFEDFLQEIQNQNESYIAGLLNYQSRAQKNRSDKIIASFKETFKTLTGYEIIVEDKNVKLNQNGKLESLNTIIEQFSPGQLMLFYLSIFISLQNNKKNKIIILDEPECHLHPSALLEFASLLKKLDCYSNLFIVTHSLFLVPEFEFENIIYIKDNKIIPRNSRTYHNLFYDMVGQDYERRTQFFSNLNQWQFAEYLAECFITPEVIDEVNANDEQVKLFIEFLKRSKSIKILDFGAGSARLGRSLRESNYEKKDLIHYDVFDIKLPKNKHGFNYFDSFDSLPKDYYDCVVMMNVLHEIEPSDWKSIFENIYKSMSKESYLLFVETSILSKGELPNKTGYLVLGNKELQKLFGINREFPTIKLSENQKSICVIIKKHYLKNITEESIYKSIKELEKNSYKHLIDERNNRTASRKYAFYTQLYINAKIFNDKNKPSKTTTKMQQTTNFNLSAEEKENLLIIMREYIGSMAFDDTSWGDLRELLSDLLVLIEYQIPIQLSALNRIWQLVIKLEQKKANKTLISLCLLSLILANYPKAKNRFVNNNYKKSLPYNIKNKVK